MPVRRYKCRLYPWPFLLDLENTKDTMGKPVDRTKILFKHLVEENNFTAKLVRHACDHFDSEDP